MANQAWDFKTASHLLRRAGFAGHISEIKALVKRGKETSVDFLLNYETLRNRNMEAVLYSLFGDGQILQNNQPLLQLWFFYRMVLTRHPVEERMTLFWHNHFATSMSKVPTPYMYSQNLVLREHALGKFDDLILAVSKHPAMVIWLDLNTSVRGTPNENFARELMELFTCGPKDVVTGKPNYTETDVQESARAFTGWTVVNGEFAFVEEQHDFGVKDFRGQTANFSGEDIISLMAADLSTARFLSKKLFEYFVYPNPEPELIEKYAALYLSSEHSIKAVLRAMFLSDEFYSDKAFGALVKSPAEYSAGLARQVKASLRNQLEVVEQLARQGQNIMFPPNVSGWPQGIGWINTTSMLERFNFANSVLTNRRDSVELSINPAQLLPDPNEITTKSELVDYFVDWMVSVPVSDEVKAALIEYLKTPDQPGNKLVLDSQTIDEKVRGLLRLICNLPEYQLS